VPSQQRRNGTHASAPHHHPVPSAHQILCHESALLRLSNTEGYGGRGFVFAATLEVEAGE
jgi:hypothetical protein